MSNINVSKSALAAPKLMDSMGTSGFGWTEKWACFGDRTLNLEDPSLSTGAFSFDTPWISVAYVRYHVKRMW